MEQMTPMYKLTFGAHGGVGKAINVSEQVLAIGHRSPVTSEA